MNILITGCNGFLARELAEYFKNENLFLTNRKSLDVLDQYGVDDFFNKNKIDFVLHTAVIGGKRGHVESVEDLFKNLKMFDNLVRNKHKYKMLINFGSGAEFDRRRSVENCKEEEIFSRLPVDYYGLSKNLITRKIVSEKGLINMRLFGCFGPHEEPQRLIRATFDNISNNRDIIVHQDKYMDFFYSGDVCRVVDHYFQNCDSDLPRDINLCYVDKKTIKNVIFCIKSLTKAQNNVILKENTFGNSYTGSNKVLQKMNLDFFGLERGIEECLIRWSKY
jgi:UDP-glucose 4-epimerase